MALRALLVAAALVAALAARQGAEPPPRAGAAGPPRASAENRAASFAFASGVEPLNQQAWLAAVARARPEARELIDRVDGLVRVEDGAPPAGALGVTVSGPAGYTIRLPFGAVFGELGQRGFDRVVQHELAHVLHSALLDAALLDRLDAGIPPGRPCPPGTRRGSCAPAEERFAETFAKWASGDIGVDLYAGYAVPPPPDLEAWGAPLAELAAR